MDNPISRDDYIHNLRLMYYQNWRYYLQLESEVFNVSKYVEFDTNNNKTYSNNFAWLLTSICAEFDTIAKQVCYLLDPSLDKDNCGIDDYKRILKTNNVKYPYDVSVYFLGYFYGTVTPLKSIEKGYSPNWWSDYNSVKHHRLENNNFKKANLGNVLHAISALFIVMKLYQKVLSDQILENPRGYGGYAPNGIIDFQLGNPWENRNQ